MSDSETTLSSGVLKSSGDIFLRDALEATLRAEWSERAALFERLLREIIEFTRQHPEERPWKCSVHTGTDGSRIFRGGTGRAIVIDPSGAMWRGRSYEDFDTEYAITGSECIITALTPRYEQMQRITL